jgi:uncharacterized protein with PIN domain
MRQVLFLRDPGYAKCPSCNSVNSLHRSRNRNLKEKLILATKLYKMYRCKSCGWRGALATIIITKKTIKMLLMYTGIALLSGFIIREILKRFLTT